jgi:murein DD-endopeptidase MepM/ murein hydrolase activator NlpD
VWVLQDDGYEAAYGHLQMDSSLVAVGMRVEAGQPLAQLGRYTGSIGGAHLHFQLGAMTERGLVSVPVAFEMQEGSSVIIPKEGQRIEL